MQPSDESSDTDYVREHETRVEGKSAQVVQKHVTPVVVTRAHAVSDQVLNVIPVRDEDVAMDAGRDLAKYNVFGLPEIALWMIATQVRRDPL